MKIYNALSAKMIDTEKQLSDQSGRMDRVEDKTKHQDTRLDSQEREIKLLREQMAKMGDMGAPGVMREMDERACKENNLVVHRVRESVEMDTRARISHDKRVIQELLDELGVEVGVEQDTKFVRRLGAMSSNGSGEEEREPRPLLVGLIHRYHSEVILENCWKLSEKEDPALRAVSIVRDLTARQRAGEKDMYKEAARKNMARTQENIETNMAFKIVGPRGSKREILAPLLGGQEVNTEGEVIWAREGDTGYSGRGMRARRRVGEAAATYPNSLVVGGPEGGTRSLGTAQGQSKGAQSQGSPHQGQGSMRGQGGRGRGGGHRDGRTAPWQGRARGSRDYRHQEGGGDWQEVGGRGSVRRRDLTRSPQEGRGPPEKRVNNMASPSSTSSQPIIISPNKYRILGEEGVADRDEDGEFKDDAVY